MYASESATNLRNQGIAHLLDGYGRLYADPDEATDIYTRQCSLNVTATDLAVMGATLADGGVNPLTGERVIDARHCKHVLAVLATAGLYERTGDWLFDIGLPGKSGVSGGIVTISPGKGGLGRLLTATRRRRQQRARPAGDAATCPRRLGLNLFASKPVVALTPERRRTRRPRHGSERERMQREVSVQTVAHDATYSVPLAMTGAPTLSYGSALAHDQSTAPVAAERAHKPPWNSTYTTPLATAGESAKPLGEDPQLVDRRSPQVGGR